MPPKEERRIGLQGAPSARISTTVTPTMYGAGIGNTLEDLGLAVYSKEIRDANQTAYMAADRKLSEAQTELQVRLGEMRGRDAMGAPDVLKRDWDKIFQTVRKNDTYNDVQGEALDRSAASRYDQLNRWVQGHVSSEKYKFQENETIGYLKASQDSAALNADNPVWVAEEKRKQEAALKEWAQRNGYGHYTEEQDFPGPGVPQAIPIYRDEVDTDLDYELRTDRMSQTASFKERKDPFFEEGARPRGRKWVGSDTYHEKLMEVQSGTNSAVIERLLNTGKDKTAKEFYDEHKAEFTVNDRARLEKTLEEGSYRGEALRKSREIIGESADLKEALTRVDKINDPELVRRVRDGVTQHYNDQAHAVKLQQDALYETAGNAIDQAVVNAKKKGLTTLTARSFVKPSEWAQLSLGEKSALQAYADHALKPVPRETNDQKYLDFIYMSPEERAQLSKRDYHTKYRQYFSDGDQARADSDLQRAREAKPGAGAKEFHVSDTQSLTDQIRDTFRTQLIDPNKKQSNYSEEEVKREAQFQRNSVAAVEAEERAKGKKLTPTERQAVVDREKDRAIKEAWVPGRFWGTNKKMAIDLTEDDKARVVVPLDKIPAGDLESLKNYFRSKNKQPTDDKLRRAYGQYMLGNRKALEQIVDEK